MPFEYPADITAQSQKRLLFPKMRRSLPLLLLLCRIPCANADAQATQNQSGNEDDFRNEIIKFIEASRFEEAKRLALEQGGPYSNEVTQGRLELLRQINEAEIAAKALRKAEASKTRETAVAGATASLAPLRREIAAALLKMDFDEALKILEKAMLDHSKTFETIQINDLKNLVAGIKDYPPAIAATFLKDKDRPITIATKNSPSEKVIVKSVNNLTILLERLPPADDAEQVLPISELAVSEKLERLAQYQSQAALIARALIISREGSQTMAIRLLQDSTVPLANDLIEAIRQKNE